MIGDPLTELAYWETWQAQVAAALPNFARQGVFVEQDSVDPDEVAAVVTSLGAPEDVAGTVRDVPYGGRPFGTAIGPVTRMWVDGNVEIGFLRRALGSLGTLDVLDIGAGYGRLAVMLAPLVRSYTCVDAVPISVEVCRTYTQRHAPTVRVLDVAGLRAALPTLRPTLAINIHSWNECSRAQITHWLDVLDNLTVPFLFTVSHGRTVDGSAYRTCEPGEPDFRSLLADRYTLQVEESLGIGGHPHALWRRR
jgi:SAM-dependent methyltransferase